MSRVKFGDVVKDVKINIDRLNNPYEYYVAGDHMDSEDLTIHRKGCFTTDDVGPAFIRVFKPGQILYGSRRTYLKKIAVADFEGVCANTTFVFETKDPHAFEQRLLPFIMLSKDFTTWSIAKSKGSTNPYVLFSDLADFEFELPPLEEQKVLVDKLWAAYRLKEAYKKLLVATDEMVKSKYNEMREDNQTEDEWLNGKPSAKLMKLLNRYQTMVENGHKPGLWFRLQWAFSLGTKILTFLNRKATDVINSLESAYYFSRKTELEQELESIASALQSIDIQKSMKELRSSSLQLLKDKIAKRYNTGQRKKFTIKDIKPRTEEFLKEYPVVLSTTYSAKSCISKDMVFDYVIMDEALQVDIKTGALALSCAMNAVIVGDDKQLPNVVGREEELALKAIQTTYQVDDRYNAITHSFLQSCVEILRDAPVTLLREHYRCHPKIIEFCNQHFYNEELIAMTTDEGEKDVLQVIRTVPGNHARGHFNQREIDVITQEVLPECAKSESIGIITPYRAQAEAINKTVGKDIASTVHKYQGRECDTIIMSMVDNYPTEFSDDANLLNVAISRAKTKLCLVTNGNEMPEDSNLSLLISYIQYNNFEVKSSKLHSVFDLLYQQYTAERLAYEAAHPAVSEHLSENLIYDILLKAIAELGLLHTGVFCHYPLSRLIADWNQLEDKEKAFVESPFSHVDFLLYNSLTKQPISAIEVDGWHFHKENDAQQSRDALKNQIFTKLGLHLLRISTADTVNQETIKKSLLAIL